MSNIDQAVMNQVVGPSESRRGLQYSDARSQPMNPTYTPDPGIPPGAAAAAANVPNTFASIMNAFPVSGGPPGP